MNSSSPLFHQKNYSILAIVLHWLMALMIVITVPLAWIMTDMQTSPQKLQFYSWHKWLGVSIFFLAALRLIARLIQGVPEAPAGMPDWQRTASRVSHAAMYVLLLAIPLSGWVMSSAAGVPVVYLGIWQLPDLVGKDKALLNTMKEAHALLANGLLIIVAVHILAALKHHFINRDGVLARMLPFLKRR